MCEVNSPTLNTDICKYNLTIFGISSVFPPRPKNK